MTDQRILDEGAIHDVLRNERRRFALEELCENGNVLSVRDLSERVAALETGESPAPRNIRQSVYVSLHQTHLPKLDELGIVEYDADAKAVGLTDRVRELEAYTDLTATKESESEPASRSSHMMWYYLSISLVGLCLTGAVAVGIPVVAEGGSAAIAAVLFASTLVLAAYQVRSERNRENSDRAYDRLEFDRDRS